MQLVMALLFVELCLFMFRLWIQMVLPQPPASRFVSLTLLVASVVVVVCLWLLKFRVGVVT